MRANHLGKNSDRFLVMLTYNSPAGEFMRTLVYIFTNAEITALSHNQMLIEQLTLYFQAVQIDYTNLSTGQIGSASLK